MGDYSLINTVQAGGDNRKTMAVGRSTITIEECAVYQVFNAGLTFIAEVAIDNSDNADDPPGSLRKISITGLDSPGSKKTQQWGRVKMFVAAIYGVDPEAAIPMEGQTWESLFSYAIDESQPLKGQKMLVDSYEKQTKAGYPFRIWSFSRMQG